jgi:NADPH-dependent 2,4-dienoyl-CoA reductase/sulfur reductase-like enzyme/rhodanese-related sulfurtransferase
MKKNRIIVIGGTACGPKTAARARRCDPQAEITVIEQGSNLSTATCGLPYYVSGVIKNQSDLLMRGASFFKAVLDIEVRTGTRAIKIDRKARTVETLDLRKERVSNLEYDKLVLATGSLPVLPALEGARLGGIFSLSGLEDAGAIKNYLTPDVKKALIVGAGLIGMEMAEALVSRKVEVTVLDALNWLLPALLDFELAAYLGKQVKKQGVKMRFGQRITGFEGDSAGRVKKVLTDSGALETDLVLMAIGRRPNSALAREAELAIGDKGGVSVDLHLLTSDPAIYAGGDCVENLDLVTNKTTLAPLGSTANKHGRVIGSNVTGGRETFPGIVGTAIAKVFEYNVARTGLSEQEARLQGYDVVSSLAPGQEHARYYPGSRDIIVKLVAEKGGGRILGGQVVGPGDAAKRIDVLATALTFGATVDDLANVDLAYAPPYNSALDPLHNAANVIRNKRSGLAKSVTPMEVKQKLERGDNFIFLDVRSESEWKSNHIAAPQARLIPLDKLRQFLDTLPKDTEIITCCQASVRAYQAQRILDGAGFNNVKFMDGSLAAWPYESTGQ